MGVRGGAASAIRPGGHQRGAYYLSNWDGVLPEAIDSGVLQTMLPEDQPIPMVAASDLGEAAADRLLSAVDDVGIRSVEGPQRYSPADVAAALAAAIGRSVRVEVAPREQWQAIFEQLGFSEAAAESYARMTRVSVDDEFDAPDDAVRGRVTLSEYVAELVAKA